MLCSKRTLLCFTNSFKSISCMVLPVVYMLSLTSFLQIYLLQHLFDQCPHTDSRVLYQVFHFLDKAGDSAVSVDTFIQNNLYPLLVNCLIEGDEEISTLVLDAIKRLAEIPKGIVSNVFFLTY